MVSVPLIYMLFASNEGFESVNSHVLQKFKMADSVSTLSEIACVHGIPNKQYFPFG